MKQPLQTTAALSAVLIAATIWAETPPATQPAPNAAVADPPTQPSAHWTPTAEPKPLSDRVQRALAWLLATQQDNGGWSQGEESVHMGSGRPEILARPNVADTCISILALMRAGSTPQSGPHHPQIQRGLGYVCAQIEESDTTSLKVTDVEGTRVQLKIGPYIDTFLAALLLTEAQNQMPDAAGNLRIAAALAKVIDKMEKNQKADGTWDGRGWAAVMSQALASKALNRAAQAGIDVDAAILDRAADRAAGHFDERAGSFTVADDAADIELYAAAGNIAAIQEADATKAIDQENLTAALDAATSDAQRAEIRRQLDDISAYRGKAGQAIDAVSDRLNDPRFVAGFGSNGGEEFLSYMLIGESLVQAGGNDWKQWDQSMTENLNRIQNADGSWSGHHCITGRNFCTATALMVLTLDRARFPVAANIKRR